ncbi:hypothetical protein [Klenkia brasiliensis]|uniref:Cell wall binding repeat 2 n=1 Tax=Klenkia brasiliensis TaxID=333142 RepID=A0A1G7UI35_9ACTN|nr:hypothetical protein [Klenkia brasiliensis]SDG47147.1 hypothetical protein SAMN05660324_2642 [Klenkia brasiliensis]
MRSRRVPVRGAVAALAGLVLVASCSSGADGGDAEPTSASAGPQQPVLAAPQAGVVLVADADPAAAAVSASRALFTSSPVVVVAPAADPLPEDAVDAAEQLHVPLLLAGGDAGALTAELDRLGAQQVVLADGAPDTGLGDRDAVPLTDELPGVTAPEPLEGVVALSSGGPETAAAAVTARAAGAAVADTAGQTDPRASAAAVDALAGTRPSTVLALGAAFTGAAGLDWKTATAATGEQLPGGGQLLFPEHFLVAMYGSTEGPALGVLGEQGLDASIARAQQFAAPYAGLLPDRTVVPTFEIIVTVASGSAGPDGNYSTELDPEALRPYVEAAGAAGLYVILDLQPGRTDFLTQAKLYQSLLELPYVGLALDPEWRLGPDQVHLRQIGSVGIDEVNAVVTWLADLTRAGALPQKLLVLHQFRLSMITDRGRLDTSRDELALLVHVDGQGSQPDKQGTWDALHQGAPSPVYWGWKNFIDEDSPMLTPEQTVQQAQPLPELVTYQ